MTIDTKTGLPELPANYFWRVVDGHHIEIRESIPGTDWSDWEDVHPFDYDPGYDFLYRLERGAEGFETQTQRRTTQVETTEIREEEQIRKEEYEVRGFFGTKTKVRTVRETVEVEVPVVREGVKQKSTRTAAGTERVYRHRFGEWGKRFEDVKESIREPGRSHGIYYTYTPPTYRDVIVKREVEYLKTPSPTTPENLYQRCLETLSGWREHQARDNLIGDYPPKKLGGA